MYFLRISWPIWQLFHVLTFRQSSLIRRLPVREDCLDEDANGALGRVPPADDAEPEAFPARALFEGHT